MPGSSHLCKAEIKEWILNNISKDSKILDIGPGKGYYGIHLKNLGYENIDCVEIFYPYIEKFNLNSIYNCVINKNALYFKDYDKYDLIIFGDVIEHFNREDAQKLLEKIKQQVKYIIISVPYNYIQHECFDNIYETHLQNDLSVENFKKYYPDFILLKSDIDNINLTPTGENIIISAWYWKKEN